jgi:hypothetical protein
MALATTLAIVAFSGLLGPTLRALSSFVAFFAAFAAAPLIAYATGGRYYTARTPQDSAAAAARSSAASASTASSART